MFPDVKFIFYPLTHALAILVFFLCMRRWLEGIPHRNRYALWTAVLYIFCNGVMAKVFHFAFQASETPPVVEFFNPLFYFRPGFWGWLMAFLPLSFLFPFLFKVNRVRYYRGLALTLPLIVAMQKTACFIAGCCAGDRTTMAWAVVFPEGSSAWLEGAPVHPTQIYDALLALSWYLILRLLDRRESLRPYLFLFFLACYGTSRFFTEMLRPEFNNGFSESQKLEVFVLAGITLTLIFGRQLWLTLLGVRPWAKKA
jgi:phosphatidylglycerol:prolipoprotein diacylglycerol transferase